MSSWFLISDSNIAFYSFCLFLSFSIFGLFNLILVINPKLLSSILPCFLLLPSSDLIYKFLNTELRLIFYSIWLCFFILSILGISCILSVLLFGYSYGLIFISLDELLGCSSYCTSSFEVADGLSEGMIGLSSVGTFY